MNIIEPLLDPISDRDKQFVFDGYASLLRPQYFRFELPKFRRDIPFGIRQCLFANVVRRYQRRPAVSNFDIVTEHSIIADLQRLDPGLAFLLLFEGLKHRFAVASNAPILVELLIVTVFDDPSVADRIARVLDERPVDQLRKILIVVEPVPT